MDLFDIAIAKKLSGGGGGNANRVQTVTGTGANPWGNIDASELYTALLNDNATAYMSIQNIPQVYLMAYHDDSNPTYDSLFINSVADMEFNDQQGINHYTVYDISWSTSGTLDVFNYIHDNAVMDGMSYASQVPTELTVIWHPLP